MAQQFYFENSTQTTVKYSTLDLGDFFIYSNTPYIKPDYAGKAVNIETGAVANLSDNADVLCPANAIIKFE